MRKLWFDVRHLAIGIVVVTGGCRATPSNSVADDHNQTVAVGSTSNVSETAKPPTDYNRSWEKKVPHIGEDMVEDDVPRSAYPLIRQFVSSDFRCDTSYPRCTFEKLRSDLIKKKICLGRWNDPLDENGVRIRSWHICDKTSIWTNSDTNFGWGPS